MNGPQFPQLEKGEVHSRVSPQYTTHQAITLGRREGQEATDGHQSESGADSSPYAHILGA